MKGTVLDAVEAWQKGAFLPGSVPCINQLKPPPPPKQTFGT